MGDQDMTTFDDADWSEDSRMDECDPGAPLDVAAEASAHRYADFSRAAFVYRLRLQILPNDEEHREGFDNPTDFRIGDPNVHFQAAAAKPYEISCENPTTRQLPVLTQVRSAVLASARKHKTQNTRKPRQT